jgi:hypothetical protein
MRRKKKGRWIKKARGSFIDDPAWIRNRVATIPGLHHRLGGEEVPLHRTRVDVPAFPFRSLDAGQMAYRRLAGLVRTAEDTFFPGHRNLQLFSAELFS